MKLELSKYRSLTELPIEELRLRKYSIYVIDYDWKFLFANEHSIAKFEGKDLAGKHIKTIWQENPHYNFQPVFNMLKDKVRQRKPMEVHSRSPLTRKAIEIVGYPLNDCYYFSIYELPDKESLLSELKSLLKKK